MRTAFLVFVTTLTFATAASAQWLEPGSYLCVVEQRASISSVHLEDADPPRAGASSEPYRFRIAVSAEPNSDRLIVEEAPYDGPERSNFVWEDENSTLHSPYVGSDYLYEAIGDVPGFLRFTRDRRWGEDLQFYHAGFQFAGGDDTNLSVRWGRCARE